MPKIVLAVLLAAGTAIAFAGTARANPGDPFDFSDNVAVFTTASPTTPVYNTEPSPSGTNDNVIAGANENAGASSGYAYLYLPFTESGSGFANWFEIPDSSGGINSFQVTNDAGSAITVGSDAGFFLSPTQIPLDELNLGDSPRQPGFIPLPGLDGATIGPSQSLTAGVPEPLSLALLGSGLAGLVVARRLRRAP